MTIVKGKDFWGPSTWYSIHILTNFYTPSKRVYWVNFMESLSHLLPCMECRLHLQSNLKQYKMTNYLNRKIDLFMWTYVLHDMVNKQISSNPYSSSQKTIKVSIQYESAKSKYKLRDINDVRDIINFGVNWGNHIWRMIHSIAMTYTPDNRSHFEVFLKSLTNLLPETGGWRHNFSATLNKYPPTKHLTDNKSLFFWTYFIHNVINKDYAKKRIIKYEDVENIYDRALKDDCEKCSVTK